MIILSMLYTNDYKLKINFNMYCSRPRKIGTSSTAKREAQVRNQMEALKIFLSRIIINSFTFV